MLEEKMYRITSIIVKKIFFKEMKYVVALTIKVVLRDERHVAHCYFYKAQALI